MVLGAVDSTGKIILDVDYWTIIISDDRQRFTVVDYKTRKHGVLDRKGNIIVPFGEYAYIDGFDHGLARVKKDNRWGLINNNGDVVLQTEYDRIWSFHGKNRTSTKVIKGNSEWDVSFSSLIMGYTTIVDDTTADYIPIYDDEPETYNEYNGSYAQDIMGYSDQTIDDAFDGDPDAYWNID